MPFQRILIQSGINQSVRSISSPDTEIGNKYYGFRVAIYLYLCMCMCHVSFGGASTTVIGRTSSVKHSRNYFSTITLLNTPSHAYSYRQQNTTIRFIICFCCCCWVFLDCGRKRWLVQHTGRSTSIYLNEQPLETKTAHIEHKPSGEVRRAKGMRNSKTVRVFKIKMMKPNNRNSFEFSEARRKQNQREENRGRMLRSEMK